MKFDHISYKAFDIRIEVLVLKYETRSYDYFRL